MGVLGPLLLLVHLGMVLTGNGRPSQPRLRFSHAELVKNGRLLTLPLPAGDLHSLLVDEDGRRLYAAMKDNLLATSLDDITQGPRKIYWPASPDRIQECLMAGKDPETECANFLRVLQPYNHTHLYVCGTGAFNPRCAFIPTAVFFKGDRQAVSPGQTECGKGKCPYEPHQRTASAIIDGELYAGISSDFMGRDTAFFRSLGSRHVIRTEQYESTWLQDAQFVKVAAIPESDNPEDDKVYMFFTERAQEAEGGAGKVLYSRVARVCKNDIGGQRSLVNKWSTFQKARLVCSIPGEDGIQTHFDQLQDIFLLHGKDKMSPLIYGLFATTSNVLNGSAVCVYRMQDIIRTFKGRFSHKEGPQYKWAEFTGRVPYPRPGTCPSSTYGNHLSTRDYPDDVIFFSRTHPLMLEEVYPVGERPLLVRVGVPYKFTCLGVDRVEAVDGQYDVLFVGTDSGEVLKSIHVPREQPGGQEVILEQLQVFKGKSPISAMAMSKKRQWLFVGSSEGVAQLALFQCELYGQACAECCLARDPYCTWDGHACSPFVATARRRNARQVGDAGDPLMQCVRQGGGAGGAACDDRQGASDPTGGAVPLGGVPLPAGGARLPLDCRHREARRGEPLLRGTALPGRPGPGAALRGALQPPLPGQGPQERRRLGRPEAEKPRERPRRRRRSRRSRRTGEEEQEQSSHPWATAAAQCLERHMFSRAILLWLSPYAHTHTHTHTHT
ncbi:sema domain, immunoglobulin domain (Ig), short basic domain, secreted, (semaphorin) 3H isoform X2 [Scleropages formosus]|uniref:Sema domain, immunoglobulin domain (Ig), short basic domain, secreted, (semaphorin) 3H n=1 Tax=Scleropages formosus TaxID=113540 RepID=A0A8C9RVV0_SCLFO|nr:semaphorin-3G isoform X2 [Scleropages formosus]